MSRARVSPMWPAGRRSGLGGRRLLRLHEILRPRHLLLPRGTLGAWTVLRPSPAPPYPSFDRRFLSVSSYSVLDAPVHAAAKRSSSVAMFSSTAIRSAASGASE